MKNRKSIKSLDKNHLEKLIFDEIKINDNSCDLNFIDTSSIMDMSFLFASYNFNGNISKWNTSNVIDMSYMFSDSNFNGNISNWNTSNVTNISNMFSHSNFNNDISNWDTSNVINMTRLFHNSEFSGDISNWNINKLEFIYSIFYKSKSNNIPYWAKIDDYNERIKAYQAYHTQKERELLLNNLEQNNSFILHNKNIIKI